MNGNKLLIGPGLDQMAWNADADYLKKIRASYSIIDVRDGICLKSGIMNEFRLYYGLVKIKDMYYAILGRTKTEEWELSKSIDIFNHSSGEWELISGINYDIEVPFA